MGLEAASETPVCRFGLFPISTWYNPSSRYPDGIGTETHIGPVPDLFAWT
jgi:hypothetical protein